MKCHNWKRLLFVSFLMLVLYLCMPTFPVVAQGLKTDQSSSAVTEQASQEVDANVAAMTDKQVRQAYAQKLKQESAAQFSSTPMAGGEGTRQGVSAKFYGAARVVAADLKRIGSFFSGEQKNSGQWRDAIAKLTDGKGASHLLLTLISLIVIIAFGLAVRWFFRRSTFDIQQNILNAVRLGKLQFLGRILSRMLLDALGVGIYILATFIIFALFFREGAPSYLIVSSSLIISYYIIVLGFGARVIFSPQAASLRLFPMEDQDAMFLYKWILRIIFIAGFFAGISLIFRQFGVSSLLYLSMDSSSGAVVILALVIMIWQSRQRVGQAIWTEGSDAESGGSSLRAAFARNWHYYAIVYVLVVGGIWTAKALNAENVTVLNLILSIFCLLYTSDAADDQGLV